MKVETIKQLQQSISMAHWKLNLDRFAEAIGSDAEHTYTQDKFREFTALSKALSQFDPETLANIVNTAQ